LKTTKIGTFKILSKTDNIIDNIATAARVCTQKQDKASPETNYKLVKNLLARGHYAMIEFADMTVEFSNVSRGFTHEMVRHRLCSFGQQSTRYVDESDLHVVLPPHKDEHQRTKRSSKPIEYFQLIEEMYKSLRESGYKLEDARQVLPIATQSQIVVKANLREWRHIFEMRCDFYAHWEIRSVMLRLLKWAKQDIPLIFDDFSFFQSTKTNQIYAKKIMSKSQIEDALSHYLKCNPDVDLNLLLVSSKSKPVKIEIESRLLP